jgi:hypothetical protein
VLGVHCTALHATPPSLTPLTRRTRWRCYVFNVRLTPPIHIHPPAPIPPSLHSPLHQSPGGQDGCVMFLMFGSLHPSTSTHLHPSLLHSTHQSPKGQDGCVMFLIFGSLHPSTSCTPPSLIALTSHQKDKMAVLCF